MRITSDLVATREPYSYPSIALADRGDPGFAKKIWLPLDRDLLMADSSYTINEIFHNLS